MKTLLVIVATITYIVTVGVPSSDSNRILEEELG